jgi:phosphocarrier protein
MKEFFYTIQDKDGIHARPAGLLVKKAKEFADSQITIYKGSEAADIKKLFAMMKLGIKQNDEVKITVEGGNEEVVATELHEFLKNTL